MGIRSLFGGRRERAGVADLLEQVRHGTTAERSRAVWELKDRGDLTAAERVAVEDAARHAVVEDPEVVIRFEAVLLLDALGHRDEHRPVVEVLQGEEGDRFMAATIAAWFPRPEVVDALVAVVEREEDDLVLEAAAASLGEIGDPRAVPALEGLRSRTRVGEVRRAAEQAIRRTRGG